MKYTKQYSTEAAYDADVANLIKPNVSFIEENNGIVKYNPFNIDGKIAKAGTIVLANNEEPSKKIFVPKDIWTKDAYNDKFTPIGVVVVPFTHTPDGTVRIMSLKNMSILTPANGSTSQNGNTADTSMHWGGVSITGSGQDTGYTYVDVGLPKKNIVPNIDPSNQVAGTIGSPSYARVPSNYIDGVTFSTGTASTIDVGTKYYTGNTISEYGISPYAIYDSKSYEAFKVINQSRNAMLDFNGASNTSTILTFQDSSEITAAYDSDQFAPAATCHAYQTIGMPAGQWYLPACGELAYLPARYADINDALTKLMEADSSNAIRLWRDDSTVHDSSYSVFGSWLWSSTEYSSNDARYVYVSDGRVYDYNKSYSYTSNRVRAFAALNV